MGPVGASRLLLLLLLLARLLRLLSSLGCEVKEMDEQVLILSSWPSVASAAAVGVVVMAVSP